MPEQARPEGVSVVLPVHGNAVMLPELCRRVRAAVGERRLEIVAVDDASPDDSLAVMRELGVVVVALSPRRGQNAALLAGLRRASQPLSCVMDADLQDPPEAIPLLLGELERSDARVVFSTREPTSRATSRVFRWLIRALFPSLPRTACLCFALDRGAREALVAFASDRDYLVAVIGALGLRTAAVSVRRARRPHGRSAYGTWRRLRYAASALASAARLRVKTLPSAAGARSVAGSRWKGRSRREQGGEQARG